MKTPRSLILLSVLYLLSPAPAAATTYHVAPPPKGNDSNPGTAELPWATPYRAALVVNNAPFLKPGDTVYFHQGSYLLPRSVSWYAAGTATAPITIASAPNETATMVFDSVDTTNDSATPWQQHIFATGGPYGTSYLVFDRLVITQSQRSWDALLPMIASGFNFGAMKMWGHHHTVKNTRIDYVMGPGILSSGSHFTADNCDITRTRSHGFYIAAADGVFRNSRLDGSGGHPNQQGFQIQYSSATRNKIYGNVIRNGRASGVVFSGKVSYNEVFNNVFIDCGIGAGWGSVLSWWFERDPGTTDVGYTGPGNKFYNNTILGQRPNQAFIKPANTDTELQAAQGSQDIAVFNNIFTAETSAPFGGNPAFNVHDNIFWNASGVPSGNLVADPRLTNLGGTDATSAKLLAGSPAIGKAIAGYPSVDFSGALRGSPGDIGAFEYAGAVNAAPSAPTALNVQ